MNMTFKQTTAFLFLLVLINFSHAQQHKISLKNGGEIYGDIVSPPQNEYMLVKTNDGNTWPFLDAEVAKVDTLKFGRHGRYSNTTSIGFMPGGNAYQPNNILTLEMLHAFRLLPYLSVGAGFGFEDFRTKQLPLFFHAEARTANNKIYPFMYFRYGQSFKLEDPVYDEYLSVSQKQGWLAESGLGLSIRLSSGFSFVTKVSYRHHEIIFDAERYYWNNQEVTRIEVYNRPVVSFGFRFN